MIHTCNYCGTNYAYYDSTCISCCGDITSLSHTQELIKQELLDITGLQEKLQDRLEYHLGPDISGYLAETDWDHSIRFLYKIDMEHKPIVHHLFTLQPWMSEHEFEKQPWLGTLWGDAMRDGTRHIGTLFGSPDDTTRNW